jgi:hypothetical protein
MGDFTIFRMAISPSDHRGFYGEGVASFPFVCAGEFAM